MEQFREIFPGQRSDEKVIYFVRRHWVSFLPTILITFLLIVFPLAVLAAAIHGFKIQLSGEIFKFITLGVSAYILFILTFFIVGWVDYYFDVLIITDERLVNIEQNGLFNRHISELDLLRVQNVSTSVKGVFQTMLDYGCLTVETAGEVVIMDEANSRYSDFTMESFPHPNKIAEMILDLHQQLVDKRGQARAATIAEGEIHPTPPSNPPDNPPSSPASPTEPPATPPSDLNPIARSAPATPSNPNTPPIPNSPLISKVTDEGQLKEGEIVDL